jgi:hypothetical protein
MRQRQRRRRARRAAAAPAAVLAAAGACPGSALERLDNDAADPASAATRESLALGVEHRLR